MVIKRFLLWPSVLQDFNGHYNLLPAATSSAVCIGTAFSTVRIPDDLPRLQVRLEQVGPVALARAFACRFDIADEFIEDLQAFLVVLDQAETRLRLRVQVQVG